MPTPKRRRLVCTCPPVLVDRSIDPHCPTHGDGSHLADPPHVEPTTDEMRQFEQLTHRLASASSYATAYAAFTLGLRLGAHRR